MELTTLMITTGVVGAITAAGMPRAGPVIIFRALGEAVALARSELQVDIDIDPTPITPGPDRVSPESHALGTLRFRASPEGLEPEHPTGRIIYCRAAVTADAPWDVRDFARRNKQFPNHSTMDQLFTDEKFESYRALGAHAARMAVRDWRTQAVRAKMREVLQKHAQERAWITYTGLAQVLGAELAAAKLTSLRPLLHEIAAEEEVALRPPLVVIVQETRPSGELYLELERVYDYWQPLPAGS